VEAVVVSTEEVAVSTVAALLVGSMGAASAVALSTGVVVSVGNVSAVAVSMAAAFVVAVLVGAITDSLMMSSSVASAFRGRGAGIIRTDITRTITMAMDTAGTRTAMDTASTVTTVAPVMDIAMEAERVIDMATAVAPVTDTAMAADQGISAVRGAGDKHGYGSLKYRQPLGVWRSNRKWCSRPGSPEYSSRNSM